MTGTRDDPQGLRAQVAALHGAGAWVHLSNAAAARCALDLLGGLGVNLSTPPAVVTAGASLLADALRRQAVDVSEVQWQPPAGDPGSLAAVMGDPRRVGANARALTAMLAAEAHLVDVLPAAEALGLGPGEFLHAGPPVEWERASGPMRGALVGAMLFEGLAATPEDAERRLAAGDGRELGAVPQPGRGRADGRA